MPLIKKYKGVLVEKSFKKFENSDGTTTEGYFCQLLDENGALIPFWCPEGNASILGEEQTVSEYKEKKAIEVPLREREWEGKIKRSVAVE